jgi:hypothetical protein
MTANLEREIKLREEIEGSEDAAHGLPMTKMLFDHG